jgi:hypothetical protein
MYDQVIVRFPLEGKVPANKIVGAKTRYAHMVRNWMIGKSYLPILDLESSWWVKYLPEEDAYEVRYVDQGIYYNGEDIDQWAGWLLEQLIPTMKKPSRTSSTPSDST